MESLYNVPQVVKHSGGHGLLKFEAELTRLEGLIEDESVRRMEGASHLGHVMPVHARLAALELHNAARLTGHAVPQIDSGTELDCDSHHKDRMHSFQWGVKRCLQFISAERPNLHQIACSRYRISRIIRMVPIPIPGPA